MSTPAQDIIPPDWHRWSQSMPVVVRQLAGGLTNRSYLLATGGDRLVLRLNSDISTVLDLDRAAEVAALRRADKAGLCAPLVYCDPGYRYLVTRFIEGREWQADNAAAIPQLAELLQRVHRLPAIGARLDIDDKVSNYWQSIDPRAGFYALLKELDERIQGHAQAAKQQTAGLGLCHNDLSPANLIATDSGRLLAIDWEYAAMGDPFHDLAVIVEEHQLVRAQQLRLLEFYLGREASAGDCQRLGHWRVLYRYLALLWYAVRWSVGDSQGAAGVEAMAREMLAIA